MGNNNRFQRFAATINEAYSVREGSVRRTLRLPRDWAPWVKQGSERSSKDRNNHTTVIHDALRLGATHRLASAYHLPVHLARIQRLAAAVIRPAPTYAVPALAGRYTPQSGDVKITMRVAIPATALTEAVTKHCHVDEITLINDGLRVLGAASQLREDVGLHVAGTGSVEDALGVHPSGELLVWPVHSDYRRFGSPPR